MKFARYLKDTQTPEWKKAYIDYRGLKKLITAIKNGQQNGNLEPLEELSESPRPSTSAEGRRSTTSNRAVPVETTVNPGYGSTGHTPPLTGRLSDGTIVPPVDLPEPALPYPAEQDSGSPPSVASVDIASLADAKRTSSPQKPQAPRAKTVSEFRSRSSVASSSSGGHGIPASGSPPGGFLANLRRRHSMRTHQRTESYSTRIVLPLSAILPTLNPLERQFIDKLDKELEKVENFYMAREREAVIRASVLKEQLRELQDHRKRFHEAKAAESMWTTLLVPRNMADRLPEFPMPASMRGGKPTAEGHTSAAQTLSSPTHEVKLNGKERNQSRSTSPDPRAAVGRGARLDPDEYKNAKKNLKKAILEYYRGLELLNNYRVLNLTGFRKALKKFEKTVKVSIQQAYMEEKVEVTALASGETIGKLLKETEDLYAAQFERGDMKKARVRLRMTAKDKSHHFSTFRSGLYLGLALPALVEGIYESFRPDVRSSIPWDSLLLVYGTLIVPTLFSVLIGINIWVWNRHRINYQFIFELDVRTQLDSREYFELPAFLLSTLIYAFWLSFRRIGAHVIASTTWPLVWIVFALIVVFNPLPVLFRSSRWWLIKKVGKLLVSGTKPVEFTDFWLGDQFCSLVFTLSNLFFVGCAYKEDWNDVWNQCSSSTHWGIPFALGVLPLVVRAVQSVKRYADSRLYTHLINGGKYCSSILYYAFYFTWRHHNRAHDYTLVLFCMFATFASLYTCAWDLLMDWSFFKHPAQRRFLRKDLAYSTNYYVYYIAIITNILIRFIWVLYIPGGNSDFQLRTFIVSMFEMLRRWQWNFFRLENEHIGNTDQYRVTREVPLPYRLDDVDNDTDDEGDDDDEENFSRRSGWGRRSVRLAPISSDEERPSSREP